MHECSWMQLVEYARPQSPSATRRRSKWPRNSNLWGGGPVLMIPKP